MPKTLIIGCGNPLRGDDGLGWVVACALADMLEEASVEIMRVHQLTPELAELVSRAERVVIVDAAYTGQPGSWKQEEVEVSKKGTDKLGHHFNPSALLSYASAVFNSAPRMLLVSVAGGSFECKEALTPAVEAALPGVIRQICGQIVSGRFQP